MTDLQSNKDLEEQIQTLRTALDGHQEAFIQVVIPWAKDWIDNRVEKEVTKNADHTLEMASERLAEMKATLERLHEALPDLAQHELGEDQIWPHHDEIPDYHHGMRTWIALHQEMRDEVDQALRGLLGHAGELLEAFGYYTAGGEDEWKKHIDGRWEYRYHLHLPGVLEAELKKYEDELDLLVEKNFTLQQVGDSSAGQARKMWEEA